MHVAAALTSPRHHRPYRRWQRQSWMSSAAFTGATLVCGFARNWGYPVGNPRPITANPVLGKRMTGAIYHRAVAQRGIPSSSSCRTSPLHVRQEYRIRLAKDGAPNGDGGGDRKRVPKFHRDHRLGSFGAGNLRHVRRAYSPRFLWCGRMARISVMGRDAGRPRCWRRSGAMACRGARRRMEPPEEEKAFQGADSAPNNETQVIPFASARLWDSASSILLRHGGYLGLVSLRRAQRADREMASRAPGSAIFRI